MTSLMTPPSSPGPQTIRQRTNQQRHHFVSRAGSSESSDAFVGSPSTPTVRKLNSVDDADAAAGQIAAALFVPLRSGTPTLAEANSPYSRSGGHLSQVSRRLNGYSGSETDLVILHSAHSIAESDKDSDNDVEVSHETGIDDLKPLLLVNSLSKDPAESTVNNKPPEVLVFGFDISHLSRKTQFLSCATGVFTFSLLYGFLQELISVKICGRKLGLFLAMAQFVGYTTWSFVLRAYVRDKRVRQGRGMGASKEYDMTKSHHATTSSCYMENGTLPYIRNVRRTNLAMVPLKLYLGLSLLRAIDLGMTNIAMQYVNYPAKTLMKSSRVVFTMLFGVLVARKHYRVMDYTVVLLMVSGLVIFMHADANSSAIFQPLGIVMLVVSLLCDGAISNMSETVMNQFDVGQDEFIFRLYSIALIAITAAATFNGDLVKGIAFLTVPGTMNEIDAGEVPTWSVAEKLFALILFSTVGFFGSSCSAAITKNFGALTMSITSTARKATTLFLSFALFNNVCTLEHVLGIIIFIAALVAKSLRASKNGSGSNVHYVKRLEKMSPVSSRGTYPRIEMEPADLYASYHHRLDHSNAHVRCTVKSENKLDVV